MACIILRGRGSRGSFVPPAQILADQLTLSQPGGWADYAHLIIDFPPRIFRPSYGPANGNFSTTNGYLYDSTVVLLIFAHKLLKSTRLPVFANFTNNRKMIKQVLLVQQPLYFLPKLYIPNNINTESLHQIRLKS